MTITVPHDVIGQSSICECGKPDTDPIHEVPRHITHLHLLAHLGRWIITCDECGEVGVGQDRLADAAAIADRHTEIGGFG